MLQSNVLKYTHSQNFNNGSLDDLYNFTALRPRLSKLCVSHILEKNKVFYPKRNV